jgi:arylamine N-acetyltransferase
MANWFVATHETSPFPTNLIAARVLDDRRLGLWNRELAVRWRDGVVEKQTLPHDKLISVLIQDFGLPQAAVLSAEPALARLPV